MFSSSGSRERLVTNWPTTGPESSNGAERVSTGGERFSSALGQNGAALVQDVMFFRQAVGDEMRSDYGVQPGDLEAPQLGVGIDSLGHPIGVGLRHRWKSASAAKL